MTISDIRLSELISPAFFDVHRAVREHRYTHFSLRGGRGSTKSSFVGIEAPLIIKRNPLIHGLVLRKVGNTLRDSVYAQYCWAIDALGISNEFDFRVSPMEIVYRPTGQKIMFRGADDKSKIKSIKVPFGYIGFTHFEELDQFAGREEVRNILQSTMRGGELFWNFETFNPPININNWTNKDVLIERSGRLCHASNYLTVPPEWLGKQFFDEAEFLRGQNERAYRHEYLGEAVGTGDNIFDNVEIRMIPDEEINEFDRIYRGLDFGWYPDPLAFVQCYYHAARRELYVFDEFVVRKMSNRDVYENLLQTRRIDLSSEIIADSAEPKSIREFRSLGCLMRRAEKGAGSVDYSMKWLQSLNKIIIDNHRCPKTAEEFLDAEYEKTRSGELISGYPDFNNHCIDAVRYALNDFWRKGDLSPRLLLKERDNAI